MPYEDGPLGHFPAMADEGFVLRGMAERQMRLSALRQTITPQMAQQATSTARDYPWMPPGVVSSMMLAQADPRIIANAATLAADAAMARGDFRPTGSEVPPTPADEERAAITQANRSGLAKIFAPVGDALGELGDELKGVARNVLAVAESPLQLLSGGVQEIMVAARDPEIEYGEVMGTAAPSTLELMIEAASQGRDYDLGEGILPAGEVEAERMERAAEFAQNVPEIAQNPLYRGKPGEVFLSPGRLLALELTKPGTREFQLASGLVDFAFNFADPVAIVSGGASKAVKARKVFGAAKGLRAALPDSARALESIGIIPGARNVVVADEVMGWMRRSKQGRGAVEWLANTSDVEAIWRGLGKQADMKTVMRLADAGDTASVRRELMRAFTGQGDDTMEPATIALREKFSAPVGMRATVKGAVRDVAGKIGVPEYVRFTQMVPHTAIDVEDLDQGVTTLDRVMRNAKLPQEIISQRINEFVRAESPDHMRAIVDDTLGDIYSKIAEWDPAVARKVTRRMRDRNGFNEAFRLYDLDAHTGLSRIGPGGKVDLHDNPVPTATILSEYMHKVIGLPDAREIRRATSAAPFRWLTADPNRVTATGALPAKVTRWGVDAASGFMTGFWQPLQLFRAAWLARVSMEQMPRMAAGGLESLGNHPGRYLLWMLGGAAEESRLWGGAKKAVGGGRGGRDFMDNPFRAGGKYDTDDVMRLFDETMNKGKSGWAGDPTRAGVSDDFQAIDARSPKFVEAWMKHNLNQLVTEPVAQRAAGGLDADDLASLGKFDPRTGKRASRPPAGPASVADDGLPRGRDVAAEFPGAASFDDIGATYRDAAKAAAAKQRFADLPDDAEIIVYHGTTPDRADDLLRRGVVDGEPRGDLPTQDAGALYVAPTWADAQRYGDEVIAFTVRKGDLRPSTEAGNADLATALFNSFDGAVLPPGHTLNVNARRVPAADRASATTRPSAPASYMDAEALPPVTGSAIPDMDPHSFDALSEWFWSGNGAAYRRRLATGGEAKQELLTNRVFADEYLKTRYLDRIQDFTGGDDELLEAIATGQLRGVNLRGMTWDPPKAVTPMERAARKRTIREQRRVYKALHEKLPELEAAGTAPKYVKIPRHEENPSVRRQLSAFVDTIFDIGFAQPDNFISRSPAYRQFFFKRGAELIPYMDRATRRQTILKARAAGLSNREVKEMQRVALNSEPGVINNLAEVNAMAHDFAAKQTKRLLYDVTERHQFAEILRVTNPFLEAWYEMFSTWGRLAAQNPKIIRRGQQLIEGARSGGFFYEDEVSGKEMFAYPGGEMMTNLGLKLADLTQRVLPGGSEGFGRDPGEGVFEGLGLPEGASVPMTGPVAGLNLAGNILPGFGPVVTIPTQFLLDPQDPELQGVRGFLLPFGADESVLDAVAPAYVKRFWTWFQNDPESDEMLRNTQLQVMTMLSATGKYTNSDLGIATEDEQAKLVADSENIAKRLFFIRGIAQFGLPTGPTPRFSVTDLRDPNNKQAFAIQALSARYRELVEENGEDTEAAMKAFVDEFGWDFTVAAQGRSRAVAVRPVTAGGYQWMQRNPELAQSLPFTVGLAAPDPNGEFDIEAYAEQFGDTREPLTTDQFAKLRNNTLGWQAYTHASSKAKAMGPAGEAWLRMYREELKERYPGFDSTVLGLAEKADVEQMIREVKRWQEFPAINETPAGAAAIRFLRYRQQALDRIKAEGGAGETTLRQANAGYPYRAWLRDVGEQIMEQQPEFAGVWRYVFEPELNQMNDDDVMLEMQEAG